MSQGNGVFYDWTTALKRTMNRCPPQHKVPLNSSAIAISASMHSDPMEERKPKRQKVQMHEQAEERQVQMHEQAEERPLQFNNLLDTHYECRIRPYIDLIDSLRELGVEKDLMLPAIAVIGDQSSGKSSVLEALSGVCLPRGNGIVTRCPLELKLKKNRSVTHWSATISYSNKKHVLNNLACVEGEVRKAQNAIAGTNGISDELITLEIVSPDVPDLTLIDLPGIIRNALPNQPKDIEKQIKQIIKKYITRQETINLAVVPCNVDVATTEALKMARDVDPTGNRTIGILTKPDLIDRGTEMQVLSTVQNQVYPLTKGYMIVKCRGQIEIQDNMSLKEALEKEKEFFENHQHFRVLLQDGQAAIPNLAQKLTKELVIHIVKTLPNITCQINTKLREAEDTLSMIGRGVSDSEDERIQFLVEIITEFTNTVKDIVNGEKDAASEELKLFKKMRELFASWDKMVRGSSTAFVNELKKDKDIYENKYRGRELVGFINYKKFENIIHKQILTFQEPAIKILRDISKLVQSCCIKEASIFFEKYRNLHSSAVDKIHDISREQEQQAENMIKLHFQMEKLIYCQDSIYCKSLPNEKRKSGSGASQKEPAQLSNDELSSHIHTYLTETMTRLSNQVPLTIQYYILKEYAKNLHSQMILLIRNQQNIHLLDETSELAAQRQELKNRIQRLSCGQARLSQFSGF